MDEEGAGDARPRDAAVSTLLLDALTTAAPHAIVAFDKARRVVHWNAAAGSFFGLTAAEVLGRTIRELPGPLAAALDEVADQALGGQRAHGLDRPWRTPGGRMLHMDVSCSPLRDEAGLVWGGVTTWADVTERRRGAEVQARLTALVEDSADAIVTYDLDGTITSWNPAAERMYGYARDEAVGMSLSVLVPPDRKRSLATLLRKVRAGVRISNYETERFRRDGTRFPVALSVSPLRSQGRVVGASAVARDISDRRRRMAERARNAALQRARAHVFHALAGMRLDEEAALRHLAETVAAYVGDACIVGLLTGDRSRLRTVAAHDRREAEREAVRALTDKCGPLLGAVARGGRPTRLNAVEKQASAIGEAWCAWHIEARYPHGLAAPVRLRGRATAAILVLRGPDGLAFDEADLELVADIADRAGYALTNARLFHDAREARAAADRARTRLRSLVRDLDGRVAARTREIETMLEELDVLTYAISHELRQPLRSIDGAAGMLLEDHGEQLGEPGRDRLHRVRVAVKRASRLIDNLLAASTVARPSFDVGEVDLSALARETVERLRAEEPERRVEAIVHPDLVARGDPRALRVVLDALVGNAWKFTSPHPTARIEVGHEGGAFFVRDDGIGFDMAFRDQLFRPLRQLEPFERFEGSGLGLATVRRVVRRHGGEVWAEGAPEMGATFWFTLGEVRPR